MTATSLDHNLDALRERLDALRLRAGAPSVEHVDLLAHALEELATTVTELQVAEEELREQNEELLVARIELEQQRQRYHDLFQFAPDAYLVTDSHGAVLEANDAAATLLGIDPQFLTGKPLVSFIGTAERRRFRDELHALHNADQLREWEVSIKPRRGEPFAAAVTITALRDRRGRPEAFRWLIRDLTERKRAEQQRLREEFLSSVSHDLRTPLTSIKGFAQLVSRQLARGQAIEAAALEERLDSIIQGTDTMDRMLRQLLDLAHRPDEVQLTLDTEPVDLVGLVRRVVEIHQKANRSHALHITTTEPELTGEWDTERLERVIMNLISNAEKYSPVGTAITISIDRAHQQRHGATARDPRNWAVLSVKDIGIGIPAADLPYVMERFHRGANVANRVPGTGLGLAGVRQTVEHHGGTIAIESQEGAGTTVTIRLPLV
jgi:PAS domain S-box-containing protein